MNDKRITYSIITDKEPLDPDKKQWFLIKWEFIEKRKATGKLIEIPMKYADAEGAIRKLVFKKK